MFEQIQEDIKAAMKAKDTEKLSALRMLATSLQYEQLEGEKSSETPSDELVTRILRREIKKRKEAARLFHEGGRDELAQREEAEIEILRAYLPEQMSETELRMIVQSAIAETGVTSMQQMGDVMKAVMPKVQGKADGSSVSKVVKEMLAG